MWLTVGNLYTRVSQATDAEIEWLRGKKSGLTYGNRKAFFDKREDEQTRFFDLLESHFPTGFLPLVVANAKAAGLKAEVIDARKVPGGAALDESKLEWLRDYQLDATRAAHAARRGIVQVSTGGGKTEIAVALARAVPIRWLFCVHRKTLLEQTAQRYELRTGEEAGRVGDGVWKPRDRFTVTTFQTLAAAARNPDPGARRRLEAFLGGFEGVFVDECHVLPADSFWRVAMMLGNAHWRIGLSATPLDREDKRSVFAVGALGPVIFKIGAQQLIAEGRLARPTIRLAKVQQEFREVDALGLPKRWPWQKVYEEGIVRSGVRNRVLLSAVAQAEKPCLVFVKDLAHGRAFAKALAKRGLKGDFVWGSASLKARQEAVRRLERGDLDVLVSSVIFQEGVDIPELRSVVIASAGKSVIAALQRIGRGMRTAEGKDTFEVWDVLDEGNAWLTRHAKARRRAYTREGYSVSVVQLVESRAP